MRVDTHTHQVKSVLKRYLSFSVEDLGGISSDHRSIKTASKGFDRRIYGPHPQRMHF